MKIIYFTNSFPFGLSADWKYEEIKILERSKIFTSIDVVPFRQIGSPAFTPYFSDKVTIHKPLFDKAPIIGISTILALVFSKRFFSYLKILFIDKAFLSKQRVVKFLTACYCSEKIINSKIFIDLIKGKGENTYLYFFWGVNSSYTVALLNKKRYPNIFVRFHRYDLYLEENDNYIPFRKSQLENIHKAIYVSQQGMEYNLRLFPNNNLLSEIKYLPVKSIGISKHSSDNVFRILTCSRTVFVKRLSLLIDSLNNIHDFLIEWTHIGDGDLLPELKKKAIDLPANVRVMFKGWLSPADISTYYNSNSVDLFVNISSSEGFPTTIIEALGHGVPILATNVGGTGEIVNDSTGLLIPKDVAENEIEGALRYFLNMNLDKKTNLKRSCEATFKLKFSPDIVENNFIEIFK